MAKSLKKSPGQIYVEQVLARREAAKVKADPRSGPVGGAIINAAMDRAERTDVEKQIGRPLTDAEILRGRLSRYNDRPGYSPTVERDQLADEIRKAEKAVAEEQYHRLSPAEKELFRLKQTAAEEHAKKTSKEEQAKRSELARAQIATLNDIEAKAAFDPTWTYSDMAAIDNARAALESTAVPFADAVSAVQAVVAIGTAKKQAIVDALKQSRAASEAKFQEQIAAIEAELGTVTPNDDAAPVEEKEPTAWDNAKAALVVWKNAETPEAKKAAMADFSRWNTVHLANEAAAKAAADDSATA